MKNSHILIRNVSVVENFECHILPIIRVLAQLALNRKGKRHKYTRTIRSYLSTFITRHMVSWLFGRFRRKLETAIKLLYSVQVSIESVTSEKLRAKHITFYKRGSSLACNVSTRILQERKPSRYCKLI